VEWLILYLHVEEKGYVKDITKSYLKSISMSRKRAVFYIT